MALPGRSPQVAEPRSNVGQLRNGRVHALYLGGVYISIANGLPAALSALIVGLQPLLTSNIANRLPGERVAARQWGGLLLGIAGVYLVVQDEAQGHWTPQFNLSRSITLQRNPDFPIWVMQTMFQISYFVPYVRG
jgi:drug/metabolite transporter (DMT)-like permease